MKTILNFIPGAGGGGLQNILSFAQILCNDESKKNSFIIVAVRDSKIHEMFSNAGFEVKEVEKGLLNRIAFELKAKKYFSPGQVCFTFWGPPIIGTKNFLINVVGCALSNLFYPEINFWGYYPFFEREKRLLKDVYQRKMLVLADYWIFETSVLARRAVELCNFPKHRVGVVRMTPSSLVSPDKIKPELTAKLNKELPKGFKFLILSSAIPNKRQHLLPVFAENMKKCRDFSFITTMDNKLAYTKAVYNKIAQKGLEKYFYNIGPIPSDDVATLIDQCDAMCSFSVLESFSNNFVEAWHMNKPLIVADADWARSSCGEGALYVDTQRPQMVAQELCRLIDDEFLRNKLVQFGRYQLSTYPNRIEKNNLYYHEIERARALSFLPKNERTQIKWPHISREPLKY